MGRQLASFLILAHQEAKMIGQLPYISVTAPRNIPESAKKSAAPRILVVDDEFLVRWAIGETLGERGYEIAEAADGESAMRAVTEPGAAPNLVLLDLRLPDSNDLSVLSFIRAQAPTTPVVVMTAHGTPDIIDRATQLGALVLNKPFDMNDLTALVESVLTRPST
jgi:DNA-binding NtrC family response regulator